MALGRAEYTLVALAIAQLKSLKVRGPAAYILADTFAANSPTFNREKFLSACGVPII